MDEKNIEEARAAIERGDLTVAQALGITVEEEAILAEQGYELMKAGKLFDAQRLFDGLAVLNPHNSYYRSALGNIFKAMDKPDEALAQFELALKANPNDLTALMALVDLHMRAKRRHQALPYVLQILHIDQDKTTDQGREADRILNKYFKKEEIRAYVDAELGKLQA